MSSKTPRKRTKKTYNYKSLFRSAARKIWMWSPMRRDAIKNARIAPGIVACANCKVSMRENPKDGDKLYQVDHIIPASEPSALIKSWDDFLERLMVPADTGLRVLCKECHSRKTKTETATRTSARSKVK